MVQQNILFVVRKGHFISGILATNWFITDQKSLPAGRFVSDLALCGRMRASSRTPRERAFAKPPFCERRAKAPCTYFPLHVSPRGPVLFKAKCNSRPCRHVRLLVCTMVHADRVYYVLHASHAQACTPVRDCKDLDFKKFSLAPTSPSSWTW